MCGVIWFSPKALPSLNFFVSIVAQFTPTRPNDLKRGKQPPKTKKGEKLQEKLLEKLGATFFCCFMNNPVAYLFFKIFT